VAPRQDAPRRATKADAAVLAILGDGERRAEERHLSPQQKKKLSADRARNKLRLDVPEWVEDLIRERAEAERLSLSAMATFLLVEGLRAYRKGAQPAKVPTRHPRWEYILAESDAGSEGLA
jgi:hypothetical protein